VRDLKGAAMFEFERSERLEPRAGVCDARPSGQSAKGGCEEVPLGGKFPSGNLSVTK
jgi:hypothetical protein